MTWDDSALLNSMKEFFGSPSDNFAPTNSTEKAPIDSLSFRSVVQETQQSSVI